MDFLEESLNFNINQIPNRSGDKLRIPGLSLCVVLFDWTNDILETAGAAYITTDYVGLILITQIADTIALTSLSTSD